MRRVFTFAAVAALVLAGCSKEESAGDSSDRSVRIDPTIANPPVVKTASRASDTDFEVGDALGLTVKMTSGGTAAADNQKMTFDGTEFKADGFLWYEDINATSTLYAYYPYQEGAAAPTEFSVQADQSGEGYTASDLIIAVKSGVYPTTKSVPMTFKHKNARIIITVTNETEFKVTGITVKGAVCTGTVDTETGAFAAKTGVEASDVKAYTATENETYYALLVPQNNVKLTVTVTTADAKTRTQTLGTTDLASGENRRMTMRVMPAEMQLTFSGPISNWDDGDDLLPDGEGTTDSTIEYGGVKYKTVVMKDGRVWMAENLRYIPTGKTVSEDFTADGDGIWYPLTPSNEADATKYVGVVSKDESVIAANGYLYTFSTAMGGVTITEENSASFEGKQGICPDGWHIPTSAEYTALIAQYLAEGQTTKASLDALNAAGFTCPLTGMRMKNNSTSAPAISGNCYEDHIMGGYMMSSTKNSYSVNATTGAITNMNKTLMLMHNATNVNAQVSNASNYAGVPVRCIKDAE